jgi:hypothetical protein
MLVESIQLSIVPIVLARIKMLPTLSGAVFGLLATSTLASAVTWKDYEAQNRTAADCPSYNDYSQKPHGPYSSGPLALPFMRPPPKCRTFKSDAVEVSSDSLWRQTRSTSV